MTRSRRRFSSNLSGYSQPLTLIDSWHNQGDNADTLIADSLSAILGNNPANPSAVHAMSTARSTVSGLPRSQARGKTYLLPGESIDLIPTPLFLGEKTPYTIDSTRKGLLYSRALQNNYKGLVVCCHGKLGITPLTNAYLTVWDYLALSLAFQGFVVASIRHVDSKLTRDDILVNAEFLLGEAEIKKNPAVKFGLKNKPLILMGVSEGGAGVLNAGRFISRFTLNGLVSTVKAVIAFAPTFESVSSQDPAADSVLILQGTHDGDTPVGAQSLPAYEAAIARTSKHFIWIHGANHRRFLGTGGTEGVDGLHTFTDTDKKTGVTTSTQQLIASNYVTGFLKWQIDHESKYRKPLIGDGVFKFGSSLNSDVKSDIAKKLLHVYPRYDAQALALSSLSGIFFWDFFQDGGKAITANNPAKFQPLRDFEAGTLFLHQRTDGFLVEWDKNKASNPLIMVTCIVANPKFIEFHATLTQPTTSAPVEGLLIPTSVLVGNVTSKTVWITIPPPLPMTTFVAVAGNVTRSVLSTIRIPYSLFEAPASTKPPLLVLDFRKSAAQSGRVAITRFFASTT